MPLEYIEIKNTNDELLMNEVVLTLQELITLPWRKEKDGTILVAYPMFYCMEKFRRFLEVLEKCDWKMRVE